MKETKISNSEDSGGYIPVKRSMYILSGKGSYDEQSFLVVVCVVFFTITDKI